jgi:hypothetical protein
MSLNTVRWGTQPASMESYPNVVTGCTRHSDPWWARSIKDPGDAHTAPASCGAARPTTSQHSRGS